MSQKLKTIDGIDRWLPSPFPADVATRSKVLLVEDDPDIRQLLADVIRHAGHGVAEAATLHEAACHIGQSSYDILVIDAHLPDGSGVPLAIQSAHEGTKVVIISGDTSEMARMRDARILYLRKPFRPHHLAALVERLVRVPA